MDKGILLLDKQGTTEPGKISYLPNDPSTPDLLVETDVPQLPAICPAFHVAGWTGQSGVAGTPQFQAALVYCTLGTTLNLVQGHLGNPISKWSSTNKLQVFPRAGNDLNAFYDRSALKFFYDSDPTANKVVFCCESADVVSHELGHGILDALRPDLWNTASLEIFAFHEAFGDIMAICHSIQWPGMVDLALQQTNGDLSNENVISRLAEELGTAIYHKTAGKAGLPQCLRNAVNDYAYVDPDTLPSSGPGLIREPHSFSQVFTGAWYDSFAQVHKVFAVDNTPAVAAVRARNVMLEILLRGVLAATETHSFYRSVLQSMLSVAVKAYGGIFAPVITDAFAKKNVIIPNARLQLLDTSYLDPKVEGNRATIATAASKLIVHLPRYHYGQGLNDNENNERCLRRAASAINYAEEKNLVGKKKDGRMFAVDNGRFVRNYICNAFCKECIQ